MGRRFRVTAASVLLGSVLGVANAAATTVLLVSGPTATAASGATTIEVRGAAADAPWGTVATYVPNGYTIDLGHPTGTRIGSAAAVVQLLETRANARATGTVLVADPNDSAVRNAAAACTGAAVHAGVWLVRLTVSAQTIDVYAYVDPTLGGDAPFGSAKLVLCLPQPYSSALPSYAPLGAKISDLTLMLSAGVFTNPLVAGNSVWRTVLTPWAGSGAALDLAAATESQALVALPASLRLHAKVKKRAVVLSGEVLENLLGIAGARVSFFANDTSAGAASTGARGTFAKRRRLPTRATYTATATIPTRTTACVSPLPSSIAPAGCLSATRAGYRLRSNSVVVTPRPR
jgi:hypothetical protein